MSLYSGSIMVPDPFGTAASAIAELYADSLDRPQVIEVTLSVAQIAFQTFIGVGIPSAAGIGRRNTVTLQPDDPKDPPCFVKLASDWATPPAAPSNYFRRMTMPTATSNFSFRGIAGLSGIILNPGQSLVVWIINASQKLISSVTVTVDL